MIFNVLEYWDANPSKLLGHRNHISSVAFSPDGQMLASGSGNKTVRLRDGIEGY